MAIGDVNENKDKPAFELTPEQIALAEAPAFTDPDSLVVDEAPEDQPESESPEEAPAEAEPQAEPVAEPVAEENWVTAGVVARAASYGLDEKDLAEFDSKEDFGRALRMYDRVAANTLSREPEKPAEQPAAPAASDESAASSPFLEDGMLNEKYFETTYEDDDGVAALVKRSNEDRRALSEIVNYITGQAEQQDNYRFHVQVDNFMPDFFGKALEDDGFTPVDISQEFAIRRDKLKEAESMLVERYSQQNQAVPNWRDLKQQAFAIAFPGVQPEQPAPTPASTPEPTPAAAPAVQVEKVTQQSRRRRPAGTGSRATAPAGVSRAPAKEQTAADLAQDPEIAKFFV